MEWSVGVCECDVRGDCEYEGVVLGELVHQYKPKQLNLWDIRPLMIEKTMQEWNPLELEQ